MTERSIYRAFGVDLEARKKDMAELSGAHARAQKLWDFVATRPCAGCGTLLGNDQADKIYNSKLALQAGYLLSGYVITCPGCRKAFSITERPHERETERSGNE